MVHFGGYDLEDVNTQVLRITNSGAVPKRIHIIPPTTPHFKLRYNKLGVVAPGMSQDVYVDFFPDEYRYYYDCVRVNCEVRRDDERRTSARTSPPPPLTLFTLNS